MNHFPSQSPQKRLAILGSTGSIGTQALCVLREHPHLGTVEVLTAHKNAALLIEQALEFMPNAVVVTHPQAYEQVAAALASHPIKVFEGAASLNEVVAWDTVDAVLNALVGFAGLEPTLCALQAGKAVALANKETLVSGGKLVMDAALHHRAPLLPVDSEHSAIFQCLQGECSPIETIWLTGSGGPFLHTPAADFASITPAQALKHPTWDMGAKISVDSATLMNKGLEVIEACRLFDVPAQQVKVVIHPQSLVHSMVQFADGSVKAQLSTPSMELPILYALSYPQRLSYPIPRIDFPSLGALRFQAPPIEKFPCLAMAYRVMEQDGNLPCALNAANEAAVAAFLAHELPFTKIPVVIDHVISHIDFIAAPTLDQLKETHREAFAMAYALYKTL